VASARQGFRLILASASPRRRELLAQAGYAFAVEAADVNESEHEDETLPSMSFVSLKKRRRRYLRAM